VIERVASADDPRLDPFRHVADPQWIRAHDLFVAEGRLVVERLLALDRFSVQAILVNRAAHDAMLPLLSSVSPAVLVCDDPTLESITGYNFHRGCLALVSRPPRIEAPAFNQARRLLGVEGVANPDNIGGLFRTAAAFGVEGVVLNATSGDPLYRKALRTSMGAALRIPYARAGDWHATLSQLRAAGFQLVALTPGEGARDLAEFAATVGKDDRVIVLVGAEGPGLDAATLALADARVRIPVDTAVDSLNVVVAAGIALLRLRECSAVGAGSSDPAGSLSPGV
jgi:tRNA G18 (ribose-2'-O)-methylase SpoU